jgi:hypothetical protein
MLLVLLKALIGPFYRQHVGIFFVVLWLGFGFMRPADHVALMQAAFGQPQPGAWLLLAGYGLLWTAYSAKLTGFLRQQLSQPPNQFLFLLRLRPRPERLGCLTVLGLAGLIPVLLYAGWMAQVGLQAGQPEAVSALISWVSILTISGVWFMEQKLHRQGAGQVGLFRWPRLRPDQPVAYPLFFPAYLLRHQPLNTLLTKTGSGLLLLGVCRLYPTDDYDQRLLLIGTVLAIAVQVGLVWRLADFERTYLRFLPGLPLSHWQRFGGYALILGLLWLPDLLMLGWNRPADISPAYLLLLWTMGLGALLLVHRIVRRQRLQPDELMPWVLGSIVGLTLLIMFGLPAWVLAAVAWLSAGWGDWPKKLIAGRRGGF